MIDADADLWASLRFLILPTLTHTLGALAEVAHPVYANLIEVLASDYIRTAKSKGLPGQLIVLRHALRNALLPTISVLALNIGYLMSGTVLICALQMVPMDGILVDGYASIDQHMLTGEAQPAEKGSGDRVLAATIVLAGPITVRVEKGRRSDDCRSDWSHLY